MKTIKLIIILSIACCQFAIAQWCGQPNPNFCPGNFFQNGDFENLTGNPGASVDNDINLSVGWNALWAGNGSLADLACGGTVHAPGQWFPNPPAPNTGVYAGMWIQNTISRTTGNGHREGMYNRLAIPIPQNNATYTFTFDISKGMAGSTAPTQPVRVGIYGVYNIGNVIAPTPAALYVPSNTNLWAATPAVQVVYLGTTVAPMTLTQNWQSQSVTFNAGILPTNGITHIMITSDDAVVTSDSRMYVNFDDFCLQQTGPPILPPPICCQDSLDIWNATGTPDPLPIQKTNSFGQAVNIASEDFVIHRDAVIPVTELRIAVTDIDFEYNYDNCAECVDNPALWASVFSTTNTIGNVPNVLNQDRLNYQSNSPSNPIPHNENWREVIWSNPNGAMLKNGDRFNVSYILPPGNDIPCCVTTVKVCIEISWKDANCNSCSINTCSDISLGDGSPSTSQLNIKVDQEGCCNRKLTASVNGATAYSWSTGATSSSIVVNDNGSYAVTATVGGSPVSTTITVSDIMSGNFPLLSFNSLFHPNHVPPFKNKFYIMDISPGKLLEGVPNSYNANEYKLEIWHRWNTGGGQGQPLKTIAGTSPDCKGFNNWDIAWDGTNQSGISLKDDRADSYVWRLTLKNCKKESSRLTYRTTFNPKCNCREYAYLFPRRKKVRLWCKKWDGCWRTETFEYGDVQMTM